MSENGDGVIHSALDIGTVAIHPERWKQPLVVSPTLTNTFNTIGLDIQPIGCVSLHDNVFGFDSSFLDSQAGQLLGRLPRLREERRMDGELPLLSIFGHADPVGGDEYNKKLSGRRAAAVYGLLRRDVEQWENLYNSPLGSDDWRDQQIVEKMANRLGLSSDTPRKRVFADYMAALCKFRLEKTDFLGQGRDSRGKADYQGCGEYNPLVILSQKETKDLAETQRNKLNHLNRRVVVYLFSPLIRINAAAWPCPRATESGAGCRNRFFPDHEQRRAAGTERKEFATIRNTFACRFYDRIARNSPCETFGSTPVRIWVRLDINPHDPERIEDEFILSDSAGSYRSVKNIRRDAQLDGNTLDLLFEGVRRGARYTLEVHPGGGGRPAYTIFENLTYEELRAFGG